MGSFLRKLLPALVALPLTFAYAAAVASAATPTQLLIPQSSAFSVLGHSCGGIAEHAYATGFDAATGYPTGAVYLSTTCSTGGRGSRPATFTAWAAATWDYTAAVVSYQKVSPAPAVSNAFSAFDSYGNEVYNTTTAAYLLLAGGFVPPPRLTGISLAQGPAGGGTSVTITGTGFTGATAVTFGTAPAASYTVGGATSITAVSPPEPGSTVDVTVTTPGGTSAVSPADRFTFVSAPTVTGLSPTSGSTYGGTAVTITGTGFTAATSVTFGGAAAGFSVDSDTSITAYAPGSDGETGRVRVTVASIGGSSAGTAADVFTYVAPPPPPTVTGISPSSGSSAGGDTVTISGTGLSDAAEVDFGGVPAPSFAIDGDTSITVVTPPGAGTVDVTVIAGGGTSAVGPADAFTYN